MFKQVLESVHVLYHRDKLWRILAQFVLMWIVVFCVYSLVRGGGGNTSQNIQTRASYSPAIPHGAFSQGGFSVGGGQGNSISMPMSTQDIQSDNRLKVLHVSAQSVDKTLPEVLQCEKMADTIAPITDYDRSRAKPVHKAIIAKADSCANKISESNARLGRLEESASAYENSKSSSTTIAAANAYSELNSFDESRSNFSMYKRAQSVSKKAFEAKQQSNQRISALSEANSAYFDSDSLTAENEVSSLYKSLSSLDKNRADVQSKTAVQNAKNIVEGAKVRASQLQEVEKYLEQLKTKYARSTVDKAGKLLTELYTTPVTLFIEKEIEKINDLKNTIFEVLKKELDTLYLADAQNSQATKKQAFSQAYNQFVQLYPSRLDEIASNIQQAGENAVDRMKESDERLAALVRCAESVRNNSNKSNIDTLLQTQAQLTAFDLGRVDESQKSALKLCGDAKAGIILSDNRINGFVIAYNEYRRRGCSKKRLAGLRKYNNQLNTFDKERMIPEVKAAYVDAQRYLARTYCIESKELMRISN
ncbi:MAG: hypothetical protein BA863_07705 [Desulfovibrio sp. S3730MH75]|nr:MAG: hypothetical protein BA863_07705 [Desulfovibrio sp. S3730MH75]